MLDKQATYAFLNESGVSFEACEHPAVHTIDEMYALDLPHKEQIVKNLFLRDDKKKNYYLVTIPGHKSANLKSLSERIPSRKLSFASEETLRTLLGLEKGQVTPLGVLNDGEKHVTVVFDESLRGQRVGIHPMENTATVFLAFEEVLRLVREHGNPTALCKID